MCPPLPKQERGPEKGERTREGGGGGVRDVNYKPATSAGNWMALICISSCMIHQHHFTTVRNITFILQMLIYDKQRIWETSELRSIKDPVTFIFFCLHECVCAGASIHAHTHPSPLDLQLDVCMCVCICVWTVSPGYMSHSHRLLSSCQEQVWFKWWVNPKLPRKYILINTFLMMEIKKNDWAQKLN